MIGIMTSRESVPRPLELLRRFVARSEGPGQCLFRLALAVEASAAWLVAVGAGEAFAAGLPEPSVVLTTLDPTFSTWEGALRQLRRAGWLRTADLVVPGLALALDAWIALASVETDLPIAIGPPLRVTVRELRNHLSHSASHTELAVQPLIEAFELFLATTAEVFAETTLRVHNGTETLAVPNDPEIDDRPCVDERP